MITEKFKELFDFGKKSKIKAGDGLKKGLYPFYTSSATLSKRLDVFQEDRVSLIFGTGGKASVHYVDEQFSTSTDCIVAYKKEDKDFNEKYVYYYLLGNIHILERGFKGAGLKHISKKYIQNLGIPILPIETQNKIVALLDKASALVQKRAESIALLDELLRAQFLEMFGDPVLNPMRWEMNKLSKICNLERGRFSPRPRNDPSYFGGEFPFIQTGDISNSNFRLTEFTQTLNLKGTKVSKEFKKGTIVIAIVGATIGKTAILEIDTYATDSIIGITAKDYLCNNYFIEMVMRFYKEYLIDRAPSAARANINLKILNNLDIISPSLKLQTKYETFNHRIEAQKETLIQSKTELENLYQSLLQRAFSGQLNFNVDIELNALLAIIDVEQDTEKEKHDIKEIATVYAARLLERIEEQEFDSQIQYQQAKQVIYQMLEEGIIAQAYDAKAKEVKLKLG